MTVKELIEVLQTLPNNLEISTTTTYQNNKQYRECTLTIKLLEKSCDSKRTD